MLVDGRFGFTSGVYDHVEGRTEFVSQSFAHRQGCRSICPFQAHNHSDYNRRRFMMILTIYEGG
jgi:hypothetical protein